MTIHSIFGKFLHEQKFLIPNDENICTIFIIDIFSRSCSCNPTQNISTRRFNHMNEEKTDTNKKVKEVLPSENLLEPLNILQRHKKQLKLDPLN